MKNIVIALAIALSGCAAQQTNQQQTTLSEAEILLNSGYKKLTNRNTKNAIADFNEVIALCADQYTNSEKKVYASRGLAETMYYMLRAAADDESAITVFPTCSDALYFRGYAALDFGQIEVAEEYLKKAIDMSPVNSMYLSELGHIYHTKRDWKSALDIFTEAEEAAKTYSPPEARESELTRAKRGAL